MEKASVTDDGQTLYTHYTV